MRFFARMNLLVKLLLLLLSCYCNAQVITTVAGNGSFGNSGNGGPATSAAFSWTSDVVTDDAGNLFIADMFNDVIRKVDVSGVVSIYAGTGIIGYSGDGGLATSAQIYHPYRMCMDNADNLYFIDQNSLAIRKIDQNGIITSITDNKNRPPGYSGDGGPLLKAEFSGISAITFDKSGNLYFSDWTNFVIRKVTPAGIVSTVVGNGVSGHSGDGGNALLAQLNRAYEVAFDDAGNMYIADAGNDRIRKVDQSGIITTFCGTGKKGYSGDGGNAAMAELNFPWAIDIDNLGNILIGDVGNNVVRRVDRNGIITTYAGNGNFGNSGDGGLATQAELGVVAGVDIDKNNDLYIAIRDNFNVVKKVSNCISASITAQPKNVSLCGNGAANFQISALNSTDYRWQVNDNGIWVDLSNNATYAGTNTNSLAIVGILPPMNNTKYRCTIRNSCGAIYSGFASLYVSTLTAPSITISGLESPICAGMSVTFNATILNGGSAPIYVWLKNGSVVGQNTPTFDTDDFKEDDIFSCRLISNVECASLNSVNSNEVKIKLAQNSTATISIAASNNSICAGEPVNFSTVVTNGGSSPGYSWYKNGVTLNSYEPSYSDNSLINGDVITCTLLSSASCATTTPLVSTPIVMSVIPSVIPTISIFSSSTEVCENTSVDFVTTVVNGGTDPVYIWEKNGQKVGSNSPKYQDANLKNGDQLSCSIVGNNACQNTLLIKSNTIFMIVHESPSVSLDQTAELCSGSSRILDAGAFAKYQWSTGTTDRTITVTDIGFYGVTVTDINGCVANAETAIDRLLPSPRDFLPLSETICSSEHVQLKPSRSFVGYLWNTGENSSTITITKPGTYWLETTDRNGCSGKESVQVIEKNCPQGFFMPNGFSPNMDGKNDVLRPTIKGNIKSYQFFVFNRFGQLIFQSTDPLNGWDGRINGINQNENIFVWTCTYQQEGGTVEYYKGSVTLIR
jgi:gliding motility-associated-like protein